MIIWLIGLCCVYSSKSAQARPTEPSYGLKLAVRHKLTQGWKKGFTMSVSVIVLLFLLTCGGCSRNSSAGGSSARSGFYIEEPFYEEDSTKNNNTTIPDIYYFFDRTLSMQGFVAENASYSTIIPQLWNVTESTKLWPQSAVSASFYEFGEGDVRKISRQFVRDNIRNKTFYGQGPHNGQIVQANNNNQVFETLSKYIATLLVKNRLFITVTDLYEQNREDNCFSVLFSEAFKRGLSGALIAVESRFNGTVENISVNSAPNIKVDGISTFFIFVIGDQYILNKYCEALFQTLEFQQARSEYVLFLIDNDSRPAQVPWTPNTRNANSNRMFERIGYNNNVNLKDDIPRLFTWNDNISKQVDTSKVESFRLLGNVRSQYIGGISVDYADTKAFSFEPLCMIGYSQGGPVEQGAFTVFETLKDNKKASFTATVINGNEVSGMNVNRYPIAIVIETKNNALDKGCYQILYEIIQKAIVPRWVIERSASSLNELEESNQPNKLIKIFRLESIYRYIAEAYNYQPEWGKIYADSLYLEKTR